MKYFSTNKQSAEINFKEATIKGQAPDKGLYFPEAIPVIEKDFIENIGDFSNEEIAFRVIKPYVGNTIPEEKLFQIVSETVDFPIPLVKVNDNISSLELFHGPTLAFKDIGARFMSRCLGHFVGTGQATDKISNNKFTRSGQADVTVLVATSGDTGGAVANGFYDVEGIEVVILYPKNRVSPVQEKQLTEEQKKQLELQKKQEQEEIRLYKIELQRAKINKEISKGFEDASEILGAVSFAVGQFDSELGQSIGVLK